MKSNPVPQQPYHSPDYPSRTPRAFLGILLCLVGFHPSSANAQAPAPVLHVSAAADLQPVLPALAIQFQKQTGIAVLPSFGSSAVLTEQIQNGSPADLFLSADCSHPQTLADAHLTTAAPILYAQGVLVLWARKDSPAQPLSLAVLTTPKITRIAVANDQHAPYGQAATAELRSLHLQQPLASKLVVGENIMQTAQFAQTGNAQAAFISLTIASSPAFRDSGSFIRLPTDYPPIHQCGVALLHGPNHDAAQAFLHWLTSPAIQSQLPHFGLDPAR